MALKKRKVNPKSQCRWQMSEIINRNLAKAYTEGAHTSLQTSPVWLSGWKSHSLGLAVDISNVSWVWLCQEHHKLASLSSVVFLYFRFHKNHEVKGSGKQNKEHEKENRKGIWQMTSTLNKDLVWFSWQVSSCSWTNSSALCSFSSPHIPLGKMSPQRCRAQAIQAALALSAWMRSIGRQQWTCFGNQSTCSESKFGGLLMHLWSDHTKHLGFLVLFCVVFSLCKDDLFCWNET